MLSRLTPSLSLTVTLAFVGCTSSRPDFGSPLDDGGKGSTDISPDRDSAGGGDRGNEGGGDGAPSHPGEEAGGPQGNSMMGDAGANGPTDGEADGETSTDNNSFPATSGGDATTSDWTTSDSTSSSHATSGSSDTPSEPDGSSSTMGSTESDEVDPDGGLVSGDAGSGRPVCGDDMAEGGEECDGQDLRGDQCADVLGRLAIGELGCDECTFDVRDCVELDPSEGILALHAATTGSVEVSIEGALVTYVTPPYVFAPAGFFLQGEPSGPAVFVQGTGVEVGDLVSLTALEVTAATDVSVVTVGSYEALSILRHGVDVSLLVQDVTQESDLTINRRAYSGEVVTAEVTTTSDAGFSGGGWLEFQITTAGLPEPSSVFVLRMPEAIVREIGLVNGCAATVEPVSFLPYNDKAQLNVWRASDLSLNACPAPLLQWADAQSPTTVLLDFNRAIDAETVATNGSQFMVSGLTVTAARVVDGNVELTTAQQVSEQAYTVAVSDSIKDYLGANVSLLDNTATFQGYSLPAVLRINEINLTMASSCDLIELRVMQGGSIHGMSLTDRAEVIHTFSGQVEPNDLLVVHVNGDSTQCNPTSAQTESSSPAEYPESEHALNRDGAYDVYTDANGINALSNVLSLWDGNQLVDAVFLTPDPEAAPNTDTQVAAAEVAGLGGWNDVGGGQPEAGYFAEGFGPSAVFDLDATGTDIAGMSLQRVGNSDTNSQADWEMSEQTWGAINQGQSGP